MAYLDLDVGTADPEDLRQQGLDYMRSQAPAGWVPNPWIVWLLGAVARMAVLVTVLTGKVPPGIFSAFGEKVLRVAKLQPTTATGTVTFNLASNPAGRTIPAGTDIDIDGVPFETTVALTLATGVLTGTVAVAAQAAGAAATGLTGATVDLIQSIVWVNTVTLNAPTAGGVDGETLDQHVDRLADETPILSPKAVLIADAGALARRDLEVVRALAIDNLIPPSTAGVEGHITVAVMAAAGANVSTGGRTRVTSALQADRILGITVHVIDPTRTALDVAVVGTCYPDQSPTTVAADVRAAIAAYLSPATWGVPPGGDSSDWTDEPLVRLNDLVVVAGRVAGMRHVSSLTLARHGSALGTSDITLDGPASVPTINLVDITATITT